MKKIFLVSAVVFGFALAAQAGVQVHIGLGFPLPLPPVVVAPAPVVFAPPPVCVPAPRVYAPPVVVYPPAPRVIVGRPPVYYGYRAGGWGPHYWGHACERPGWNRHHGYRGHR